MIDLAITARIKEDLNAPTVSKDFYQSIADLNPDFIFIVIPEGDSYPKADGLWVSNLTDFLTKRLPAIYTA